MTILRTDSTHCGITIDCANGSGFVHGGSGPLTVYSDKFKKTITVNGKTMNVKDFFLNDNLDAVEWYYKCDDYHLSYYKVWKEKTTGCLEIVFDLKEGTISSAIEEITKDKIEDFILKDKNAIKDEEENN